MGVSDKREVRLIDADALLESGICAEYGYNDNGLLLIPMRDVTNSIRNAPTIDAEPVRHGRWLYNCYPTVWYGHGEPPEWVCSECEERAYNTYDYCPNCGAKMDGGKDNENS